MMNGNGKTYRSKTTESDLVRTSRAGDAFHYRWAARFCLNMIKPGSNIESVTIEQSRETEKPGECVMDMTVYFNDCIHYYQMKHSVVRTDKHITLGELKKTIEGFSARFVAHNEDQDYNKIRYLVITNRTIDPKLLSVILKIANGETPSKTLKDQLTQYTKLSDADLRKFCGALILQGGEGNYEDQFYNLIGETGRLISGIDGTDIVNKLITMIQARALPNDRSEITRATVLYQFGCSSEKQLYPAPSDFEKLDDVVIRDEYKRLATEITASDQTKIITATGGLGKSIFTGILPELLGENFLTITYDCFGNGTYRNRQKFRHRHQDALVQIANQLADLGYCEPLIPIPSNSDPDRISEAFQQRIAEAVARFREMRKEGRIVIAIDAADNAEMAAKINEDMSFASDLIQQGLPSYCILVMLCRPERKEMLNPPGNTIELSMEPFSVDETENYLSKHVSDITRNNAEEIHRLTNGNPRVMSIAMQESISVKDILQRLGPKPTSAEEQVEVLLKQATDRIIGQLSDNYREEMDALCCGLSILPPDIPIQDLSAVTGVNEPTIISFVSEMGAQIILAENHLYFRDEPTEYWFKENYSANVELLNKFISKIEPLTSNSFYLAAALPELYIQAGYFDKMIDVVLNGMYLPEAEKADIREVEYTRLKYAVRSALNAKRYKELIGLGLMAGDRGEIHNRIYGLYQSNFDILNKFLSKEPMRELAYKGVLRGNWLGSDRLYSALLLSGIENGQPESRVYLRNAEEFLIVYFAERDRDTKLHHHQELTDEDVFAFILTIYNNFGLESAIQAISRWSPNWLVFKLSRKLSSYLIDLSLIDEVYSFLNNSISNIYCVLGISFELNKIGFKLKNCHLDSVSTNSDIEEIEILDNYMLNEDEAAPSLSLITLCEMFLEAGYHSLCLSLVEKFFNINPSEFISDHYNYKRTIALRAFAIQKYLQDDLDFFENAYFFDGKGQPKHSDEAGKIKGIFNSLYPWYALRLSVILGNHTEAFFRTLNCKKSTVLSYDGQYGRFYTIEKERYSIASDIFLKNHWSDDLEAMQYYSDILKAEKFGLPSDMVSLLRGLMRQNFFDNIIHKLETDIYQLINNTFDEPYEKVEILIRMGRSLLGFNIHDAFSYFEEAVKENESFGDDLPSKWKAIASIAKKASCCNKNEQALAYRFVRAAEFVGEHVVREKYWDRNEAVAITTLLSPAQGLASISRWRERNVGWIEEQLPCVFEVLEERGLLLGSQIWGFSGFFPQNEKVVVDLAIAAIHFSQNDEETLEIVRQVNKIAGIQGFSEDSCNRLKSVLSKVESFQGSVYPGRESSVGQLLDTSITCKKLSTADIDHLLEKWKYANIESVEAAFQNIASVNGLYSSNDYYWQRLLKNIPLQKYVDFLEDILNIQKNDFWNVSRILSNIPDTWKERRGFRDFWIGYLTKVGNKFSSALLSTYYRRPFEDQCLWFEEDWSYVYKGAMEAFKNGSGDFNSSEYYDLVSLATMIENSEVSLDFLDTALKMLEKDIDANFADGPLCSYTSYFENFENAIAGYYKVSLASPDCEVRWQAVHCLVRYGLTESSDKFLKTVNIMFAVDSNAFLDRSFKLYDLNFQLYLMIALHRIALEQPLKLAGLKDVLVSYFEPNFTHGLIQLTVLKIIEQIDAACNTIFSEAELSSYKNRFSSPFSLIEVESYYGLERSKKYMNLETTSDPFHVAFDFDRYWLNSLEQMFNIPVKHLEKMIGKYIADSMGADIDENGWIQDARSNLFRTHKYEGKTYTSHGTHPSVENLPFYFSYHSMFIIAGELLKNNPLYINRDFDDSQNPYLSWLEDKFVKRDDGFFLIDGRTEMPFRTPQWIRNRINDEWLINVDEQYLNESLFVDDDICVAGFWEYQSHEYRETIMVKSALIEREYVSSLLSTLNDMSPHDYYLGNNDHFYDEDNYPFLMKEWIVQRDVMPDLDKYDPWSIGTAYPDYEIDKPYLDILRIKPNKLGTIWTNIDNDMPVAFIQNWVENFGHYGEIDFTPSHRLMAKEKVLRQLCDKSNKALVLNIKIDRKRTRDRYSSTEESDRHSFHFFKVISADGWWSDEE